MNYAKDFKNDSPYVSVNTLIRPQKSRNLSAVPPAAQMQTNKPERDTGDILPETSVTGNLSRSENQANPLEGSTPSKVENQAVDIRAPLLQNNKVTPANNPGNSETKPETGTEPVAESEGTTENQPVLSKTEHKTEQPVVPESGEKPIKVEVFQEPGEVSGEKTSAKQDVPLKEEKIVFQAENPGQILGQLKDMPPTKAVAAYEPAQAASNTALEKQRNEAQKSLPEIPAPTGLTPQQGLHPKRKNQVSTIKEKPLAAFKAEKSGQKGREYRTQTTVAPSMPVKPTYLPGADSSASAPDKDELSKNAQNALENIRLNSGMMSTSAGERPDVDMTGEADPSQLSSFQNESNINIQNAKVEASQQINQDFGENDVLPEARAEKIKPKKTLSAPKKVIAARGDGELPLDRETAAGLNKSLGTTFSKRLGEQKEQYDAGKAKFDSDSAQARAKADKQVAALNQETRKQQMEEQGKAKLEVSKYRKEWKTELDKVDKDYQVQASKAAVDQRKKIETEKRAGEDKAARHLAEAEQKAEAEKLKAEQEANQKKNETKKESKGFWGWVKSAATALIDGLKKAVNFIFDNLRKAVKAIFEIAKTLVKGVIELARKAIVGYIKAFGVILKGLVSVVFAAFPDIARKINAKIDQAVNAAVKAVNKAADLLKKGVTAVFDFLANMVDSLLGLVQKIFNGIFTAIGMIIRGEFKKIMEGIGNLVKAAKAMPNQFWGQVSEELLGTNLGEPLPFERKAVPSPVRTAQMSEEISGISDEDRALFNRPVLTEGDVAVDEVIQDQFDPELLASLNMKEGDEIEFGASNDPSRTVAAIKEEMMGKPVSSTQPPGEKETAAGSQKALSQEEIAEQELEALMAQEPKGACTTKKSEEPAKESEIPESMKIGPLTVWQRSRYLMHQMKKGLSQWFACNWPKLLLAAVGALVGFIVLNIVTGGAILAALPLIMQIVSAVMAGVALGRVIDYVGRYFSDGWAGLKEKAAKSLARGLAVGAIELIFALIFNLGTVIKTLKTGLSASLKTAAKTFKTTITTTIKNVKELGRIGLQAGKTMVRNGKLLFKGLKTGFAKGAKSLDDLAKRLWDRVRFKKFKIVFKQGWIRLLGYINPWIVIMEGPSKGRIAEVSKEEVKGLKRGSEGLFEIEGKSVKGIVLSNTTKFPKRYRTNFDIFFGKTHNDFVIHHLIEQQTKQYTKLVDDLLLHAPANLRAIPKGTINEVVHLSKIRTMWDTLYEEIKFLSDKEIFAALKNYAVYTDNFISVMLTYADEMGEGLTKEALQEIAQQWIKANPFEDAVEMAIQAAKAAK